jgi:hypothetical protein
MRAIECPDGSFQSAGSCLLVNILFAFRRFIFTGCSRKILSIETLPRTPEMTYLKKTVALLATLTALSASLSVQAEESGAFVERNKTHSEHTVKS